MQTLHDLLKQTDALTYINSLKVTLIQIKDEVSQQEELRQHLNASSDRVKKLMRKADNQYRLIAKLVSSPDSGSPTEVMIDDLTLEELEKIMEE